MTAGHMRMHSWWVLMAVITIFCDGCGTRECSSHGSLRVGDLVPSLAGVTDTGETFHTRDPWTNLTIYAVADTYPPLRVDTGKAVQSILARKLGARLVLSGDGKIAHEFGMKVVADEPFRYDTSLLVLCETNCRVLRIWRSAGVEDLDDLLK